MVCLGVQKIMFIVFLLRLELVGFVNLNLILLVTLILYLRNNGSDFLEKK